MPRKRTGRASAVRASCPFSSIVVANGPGGAARAALPQRHASTTSTRLPGMCAATASRRKRAAAGGKRVGSGTRLDTKRSPELRSVPSRRLRQPLTFRRGRGHNHHVSSGYRLEIDGNSGQGPWFVELEVYESAVLFHHHRLVEDVPRRRDLTTDHGVTRAFPRKRVVLDVRDVDVQRTRVAVH